MTNPASTARALALLGLVAATVAAAGPLPPPTFAVLFDRLPVGEPVLRVYVNPTSVVGSTRFFRDRFIDASITDRGGDEWELSVRNIHTDPASHVIEVRFPHDPAPVALGGDASDDAVLLPWIFGMAFRSGLVPTMNGDWWRVGAYPGGHVSPLAILADPRSAWPACYSCCALDPTIHARYQASAFDVPAFARTQTPAGFHVSFYSRPHDGYRLWDPLPLPGSPTNLAWWSAWMQNQTGWGANAFYLDTVGWLDFGPPLDVARVLRDDPRVRDAVIEGALDLYPAAHLVSLALHYPGAGFPGGPGRTFDDLGPAAPRVPFPQLGNFLLDDHLIFDGQSNTGWGLWGSANAWWVERQCFLLGHKFDTYTPYEAWANPQVPDQAFGLVVQLRDQTGWWNRRPRYQDRRGLSEVPAGIDARRFVDAAGANLIAIDNWSQRAGLLLRFLGQPVAIPTAKLSVLEFPAAPCPGDVNGDRRVDAQDRHRLLARWHQAVPRGAPEDLDLKGFVDEGDLARLVEWWLRPCP